MLSLFDSKSRDIQAIVNELASPNSTVSITNESVTSEMEMQNTKDAITESMYRHYQDAFNVDSDDFMSEILKEDAEGAGQLFMNNVTEMLKEHRNSGGLLESTIAPRLNTLTTSIAVSWRIPYEATLHRMYDTRTLQKPVVDVEYVHQFIQAPNQEKEDLIDAFDPTKDEYFIDKTEFVLSDLLTKGLEPGNACKNTNLLANMDPLYKINRDMRIDHIDLATTTTGEGDSAVTTSKYADCTVQLQKGSVPYFEAKTLVMSAIYEAVDKTTGEVKAEFDIEAKMNFNEGVLEYLRADEDVAKVYFYATISHEEHTHPIKMDFSNNFEEYFVPTRPHIEVSLPKEVQTDVANSISYFGSDGGGVDMITAMTEQISVISSRMEDERLAKGLKCGHMWEAMFNYEPPANFTFGNIDWFKREFIPFLDQIATKMKCEYNLEDCHFRVAVSPFMLRLMDTEHIIDKSLTEESRGNGVINYSIGVKTSTNQFYFISSQRMAANIGLIAMLPNNFKLSPVKTYNYFRYTSFLTDTLRNSENPRRGAVVYSERNIPIVFTPVSTEMTISNMPVTIESGTRWYIKKAGATETFRG